MKFNYYLNESYYIYKLKYMNSIFQGIRQTVEMIENRGIQLGSLCTAHKEESLRITQAVRNFIEQYESVILIIIFYT